METISYKFEMFEGPLDLLLSLVEKNRMNIDDIPIDVICTQYLEYMDSARENNIELACEFIYMASELMLIKSRMLLPRDPVKDEDPRKSLIDAITEYKRAKDEAALLSDFYKEYGGRMIKEQDDVSPDRTYVAPHDIAALTKALAKVLSETGNNDRAVHESFEEIVNVKSVPVGEIINGLVNRLKKAPVRLNDFFRRSSSRSEMVAKFLCILELLKAQAAEITDENDDEGVSDLMADVTLRLTADDEKLKTLDISYT